MLKRIDPRLNADVLHAMQSMGHGDVLAVVDANFPAAAIVPQTAYGHLLRMENLTTPQALDAILSLLPLDTFAEDFAIRMQVDDAPDEIPEVQAEAQAAIDAAEGRARPMVSIERLAFYERTKGTFAVLQTGERRFWGCILLRKGVIPPED